MCFRDSDHPKREVDSCHAPYWWYAIQPVLQYIYRRSFSFPWWRKFCLRQMNIRSCFTWRIIVVVRVRLMENKWLIEFLNCYDSYSCFIFHSFCNQKASGCNQCIFIDKTWFWVLSKLRSQDLIITVLWCRNIRFETGFDLAS